MNGKQLFKGAIFSLCLCFLSASVLTACGFVTLPSVNSSQQSASVSSTDSSEDSSIDSTDRSVDSSTEQTQVLQDGIIYTLTDGEYTVAGYEGEGTSLSIAGEVNGFPVTAIGERAFYEQRTLTSVTIPDSVREIASYAFSYCEGLAELVIPDCVTKVASYAFAHCHRLARVVIGDGVTEIGAWAFYYCHALTSVTIGDGVTTIGLGAFQECFNLKDVVLGLSVQSIAGGAFGWCNSLTNVYYKGAPRDWQEVDTGANTELTSAKRYYYVEEETDVPTSGSYWHYDENGEIAVW